MTPRLCPGAEQNAGYVAAVWPAQKPVADLPHDAGIKDGGFFRRLGKIERA